MIPNDGAPARGRRRVSPALADDWHRLRRLARGFLITSLVPRGSEARRIAGFVERRLADRPWRRALIRERMEVVLGVHAAGLDLECEALAYCRRSLEEEWGHWRALHRSGWRIETTVEGLDRLAQAQASGQGVVLWGMSFCGHLAVKIALDRAGAELVHLSAADHGAHYPPTALGLRVVGPLYCSAENRYVAERVVIPASGALGYLKVLRARLEQNRCVWISGERTAPRGNAAARLFDRPIRLATGAPSLAWSVGSALLPVDVVRDGESAYRVRIDQPIEPPRTDKQSFVDAAVAEFARRLEARILEHPADWSWEVYAIEQLLPRGR